MANFNGTNGADFLPLFGFDPDPGVADVFNGFGGNDTITAFNTNDTINPGSGSDTTNAGGGNDRVIDDDFVNFDNHNGGSGVDTIDYSSITFGDGVVTINLATGVTSVSGGNTETISNFENVEGSQGGETIIGSFANNVLNGNGGNDTINGGNGNDTVNGGTGADRLDGGDNDDLYIVDNVGDIATEVFGDALGGVDTVQSSVSYTLSANLENLTLTGFAAINGTGNFRNNVINGNSANNSLFGLDGNDTINGGLGNDFVDGGTGADIMDGGDNDDTYIVDNIFDVASEIFGDALGGVDTVQSSVSYTLSANLENLTLTGFGSINGTGNFRNNVINGNSGNNSLFGLDGNDTIFGGNGNDTVNGGTGADRLDGGDNDDLYIVDNVGDIATEVFGDAL
ncbi:MAG: calcium-binding protein, partial [Nostoc sp. ChiQUE01a]|nr:calcium-binding protein [Nostoc sp. ChiQUE01a]